MRRTFYMRPSTVYSQGSALMSLNFDQAVSLYFSEERPRTISVTASARATPATITSFILLYKTYSKIGLIPPSWNVLSDRVIYWCSVHDVLELCGVEG